MEDSKEVAAEDEPPSPPEGVPNEKPLLAGGLETPNTEGRADSSFLDAPNIEIGCEAGLEAPKMDGVDVLSTFPKVDWPPPLTCEPNNNGWELPLFLLPSPSQNGFSVSLMGVGAGVREAREAAGAGVDGNIILAAGFGVRTDSVDGDARGVASLAPNNGIAGGRRVVGGAACARNLLEAKKFGTALVLPEGFSASDVFSGAEDGTAPSKENAGVSFG